MGRCNRCNQTISGNYCSNCGLSKLPARINGKYILNEIGSVLNFQRGILFSIKELLLRPGQSVKKFIHEDRKYLVKPILFILLCSLVHTVIFTVFGIKDNGVQVTGNDESTVKEVMQWIESKYGYLNIIIAFFVSIWLKLFFRKFGYSFFEILILAFYLKGVGVLFRAFMGLIQGLINIELVDFSILVTLGYFVWGSSQFFNQGKFNAYLKSFFAYLLGIITLFVCIILILYFIDTFGSPTWLGIS